MPSFLSPLFLAGAAAIGIPIVLHLLRREPEARVRFAAVHLLRQGPVEQTSRRWLRDLLLLALRVTALLLLAVAFARPFFAASDIGSSSVTIIALDTSLSMSAPGRFERARQLAVEAIDRAPVGRPVGVVAFADDAAVVSVVSGDRQRARAAVESARAGAGGTRYRPALRAASRLMDGRTGSIVVVTDLQAVGWDAGDPLELPERATIEVADVGAPPPNLAVTGLRLERDRIVATVRNAGNAPRDAVVRLVAQRGGREDRQTARPAETVASLAAGQTAEVSFDRPSGAEAASAEVADETGVAADNRRFIVLDGASSSGVLIVTASGDLSREAFYLQQALTIDGGAGVAYRMAGAGARTLSTWNASNADSYAVIVLTSTDGLDSRGREWLRGYVTGGGGLFVAAGAGMDGAVLGDVLRDVTIARPAVGGGRATMRRLAPIDVRHPMFSAFGAEAPSFGLVSFRQVTAVQGAGCEALARFTTGETAIFECRRGKGMAVILASDLDNRDNDFPRRATFVPFLHQALRYLEGAGPVRSEYIVGEEPDGVAAVPGIAPMPGPVAAARKLMAINVDPRESDPARLSAEEFQSAVARSRTLAGGAAPVPVEARQEEDRQHLWQYCLALVMVTLVAESLVAARTI